MAELARTGLQPAVDVILGLMESAVDELEGGQGEEEYYCTSIHVYGDLLLCISEAGGPSIDIIGPQIKTLCDRLGNTLRTRLENPQGDRAITALITDAVEFLSDDFPAALAEDLVREPVAEVLIAKIAEAIRELGLDSGDDDEDRDFICDNITALGSLIYRIEEIDDTNLAETIQSVENLIADLLAISREKLHDVKILETYNFLAEFLTELRKRVP